MLIGLLLTKVSNSVTDHNYRINAGIVQMDDISDDAIATTYYITHSTDPIYLNNIYIDGRNNVTFIFIRKVALSTKSDLYDVTIDTKVYDRIIKIFGVNALENDNIKIICHDAYSAYSEEHGLKLTFKSTKADVYFYKSGYCRNTDYDIYSKLKEDILYDKLKEFHKSGYNKNTDNTYNIDDYKIRGKDVTTNMKIQSIFKIKDIKFSGNCTIVFWNDNTKTIVKYNEEGSFDPEKAIAMAFTKKILSFGLNAKERSMENLFSKYIEKYNKEFIPDKHKVDKKCGNCKYLEVSNEYVTNKGVRCGSGFCYTNKSLKVPGRQFSTRACKYFAPIE